MEKRPVKLTSDLLDRHSKCSAPAAIEELIWNALDAGGSRVDVRLFFNGLSAVEAIEVRDHGTGIDPKDLDLAFGTAGHSTKPLKRTTPEGRLLHGKEGEGRFKAVSLGLHATWTTTYRDGGKLWTYTIAIQRGQADQFSVTPAVAAKTDQTGTVVRIEAVDKGDSLTSDRARNMLTERFALYLKQYPSVEIYLGDEKIDLNAVVQHEKTYALQAEPPVSVSVIEWKFKPDGRRLMFCDDAGFAWGEVNPGVAGRGIEYSAYLRSPTVKNWGQEGRLQVAELDPEIAPLVERAKGVIREHLSERLAIAAADVVQQWKKEEVYPYSDNGSMNPLERVERNVFDVVAVSVYDHHKALRDGEIEAKRLTLRLVRRSWLRSGTLGHVC